MERHLTEVNYADGTRMSFFGRPKSIPQALAKAPARMQGSVWLDFSSRAINEPLFNILDAHPGFTPTCDNSTTEVTVRCDGAQCEWGALITGREDSRGHGGELFRAHQAGMIEEAFTLVERVDTPEGQS